MISYSKYLKRRLQEGGNIVQPSGDPYEYKKENGRYFTRKKGSSDWIDITGTKYEEPVKKMFPGEVTVEEPITGEELSRMRRTYERDEGKSIGFNVPVYRPKFDMGQKRDVYIEGEQGFVGMGSDASPQVRNVEEVKLGKRKKQ